MAVTFTKQINGITLEFIEDNHLYMVDGIVVPSITRILKTKFGGKYKFVDPELLRRRADEGTRVHKAIEEWCTQGIESDYPELRGFKFLQRQYGFEVLQSEVPVVLWDCDPIAAGRLDLVLEMDGKIGGADIKRVSSLDRQYLAYQLNIYRIAYMQSYGVEWEFLKGIHLRDDKRRLVDIPIDEDAAWGLIGDFERERRMNGE